MGYDKLTIEKGNLDIKPNRMMPDGKVTIEVPISIELKVGTNPIKPDTMGIELQFGTNSLKIDNMQAELKTATRSLKFDAASATLKGITAKLQGDGMAEVKAAMVNVRASGITVIGGGLTKIGQVTTMSSNTPRPRAATGEIAARFEPSAVAAVLLTPGIGASDFVAALEAAERWLAVTDEPSRRACEAAAEALGYRSAPAMAGAAAFWSGGSPSRPDLPKVPPAETLPRKGGGRLRPDGGRLRDSRHGRAAPRADPARRGHCRSASSSRRREMTAPLEQPSRRKEG